jgi:hypothetical protein
VYTYSPHYEKWGISKIDSFLRVGHYYSMKEEKFLSRGRIFRTGASITYYYPGQ